jgi:diamine N-acetyltransferase
VKVDPATITLREVTRDNLYALWKLDAGDGGKQVASNVKSMAEAAVHGEAWPRAICEGDTPVGFLMLYDPSLVSDPERPDYYLWRLMIDQPQQGRGIGQAALRLLIAHVRTRPNAKELVTSIAEPAPQLHAFYGGLGFVATDEFDDGERVLRLRLS